MANAGEITIGVNADTGKLEGQLSGIGNTFKSVLGANIIGDPIEQALQGITDKIGDAVNRVDTLNRFPQMMQAMGYSAQEAEQSISTLSDGIKGLPTTLDSIAQTTQNLTILTNDMQGSTETALALNDAFIASGASAEDASRGMLQYTQMLSKGSVDLASWRTLQETMGYALRETAKAFGYTGTNAVNEFYSALQSGEVTFDEFNQKLIELSQGDDGFAAMAQTATGGIQTSMENAETAVTRGVANIIDSFNNMYSISDIVSGAGETVETVLDGVADHLGTILPLIAGIGSSVAIWKLSAATTSFKSAAQQAADALKQVDGDTSKVTITLTQQQAASINAANAELRRKAAEAQAAAQTAQDTATLKQKQAAALSERAATLQKVAADRQAAASEAQEAAATAKGTNADKLKANAANLTAQAANAKAAADRASAQAEQANATATQATTTATKLKADASAAATAAQGADNVAMSAGTAAAGALATGNSLATVATNALKAAQDALSNSIKSNPIGFVLSIIPMVISGVQALIDLFSTSTDESKQLVDETKQAADEAKQLSDELNNVSSNSEAGKFSAMSDQINKLVDNMGDLIGRTDLTKTQQVELQTYVDELNASYDGWNLKLTDNNQILDQTSGKFVTNANGMRTLASETLKAAKAAVELDRYKKALEGMEDAEDKVDKATADMADALKRMHSDWSDTQIADEIERITNDLDKGGSTFDWDGELGDAKEAYVQAKQAVDDYSYSVDKTKTSYEKAAAAQNDFTEGLNTNIDTGNSFVDTLYNTSMGLINATNDTTDGITQLTDTGDGVQQWGDTTSEALDSTGESAEEAAQKIQDTTDDIVNSFDKVETGMNGLSAEDAISNIAANNQAYEEWYEALDKIAQASPRVATELQNIGIASHDMAQEMVEDPALISQMEQQLIDSTYTAATGVGENFNAMSNSAKTSLNSIPDAANQSMTQTNQIINDKNSETTNAIKQHGQDVETASKDNATKIGTGFDEGATQSTGQVNQAVTNVLQQAQTTAQSKASDGTWHNVGAQITQGIAAGIRSGSSSVTSAVQSIISSALSAAKSSAKIHSPSKLFADEVGKFIPEGVALGITNNFSAVEKSFDKIQNLAYARIPEISQSVDIHAAYALESEKGALAQNSILSQQLATSQALLHKDWGISVDGRQLAIATNAANAAMGARTYKGSIGDKY